MMSFSVFNWRSDSVGTGVLVVIRSSGGAKWWRSYRVAAAPIVVDYLDRRLADPEESLITWEEIWPYWKRWVEKDAGDEPAA